MSSTTTRSTRRDAGDGATDGVVDALAAQQDRKVLEGEPGNPDALVDGVLGLGVDPEVMHATLGASSGLRAGTPPAR